MNTQTQFDSDYLTDGAPRSSAFDFENESVEVKNADISDRDILDALRDNDPVAPDDKLPRYGMSFLMPLPLFIQHGNNFITDISPKNSDGSNRVNRAFFPPFRLLPIKGGTPIIPFEKPIEYTDDLPTGRFSPTPFNASGASGARGRDMRIERTARECMGNALRAFVSLGFTEFSSLIGYHAAAEDRGVGKVLEMSRMLLPVDDANIFPRDAADASIKKYARERVGTIYEPPFLDQIIEFLTNSSLKRLATLRESGKISQESFQVAQRLHGEMLTGARAAWRLARNTINNTHEQIRDGRKAGYDMQDLAHENTMPAFDLYALAHTNETELDNKQLKASENIGKGISDGMTEGIAAGVAEGVRLALQSAGTPAAPVMTAEDVKAAVERERDALKAEFAAEREQMLAELERRFASSPSQPEDVKDAAPAAAAAAPKNAAKKK